MIKLLDQDRNSNKNNNKEKNEKDIVFVVENLRPLSSPQPYPSP